MDHPWGKLAGRKLSLGRSAYRLRPSHVAYPEPLFSFKQNGKAHRKNLVHVNPQICMKSHPSWQAVGKKKILIPTKKLDQMIHA